MIVTFMVHLLEQMKMAFLNCHLVMVHDCDIYGTFIGTNENGVFELSPCHGT